MPVTQLLIGLGNPGSDYAGTRHNIGFMALDAIAGRHGFPAWKKKFRGIATVGGDTLLLQPHTFMNLSGESALDAVQFHKLRADQVIVFHDDLDLPPGEVRVKQGGGSGGHNGLKSLDAQIGATYWRVRLGIGRPMTEPDSEGRREAVKGEAVTHYVLNPFNRADKVWLAPLLDRLAAEASVLLDGRYADYAARLRT